METNIFCNRKKLCNTIENQRKTRKILKELMLGNSEGFMELKKNMDDFRKSKDIMFWDTPKIHRKTIKLFKITEIIRKLFLQSQQIMRQHRDQGKA